jgi:hypothetical protein
MQDRGEKNERDRPESDVEHPLRHPRRARKTNRRQAHQGHALHRVHLGAGTEDVEEARHHIDLDAPASERTEVVEQAALVLAREGDDDPLDVELVDDPGEILDPAEERQLREVLPTESRCLVDEAEEVDAVLRVAKDLGADQLANVARAHDHGVLEIAREVHREPPGRRS